MKAVFLTYTLVTIFGLVLISSNALAADFSLAYGSIPKRERGKSFFIRDEERRIIVEPTFGLVTSEAGGSDSFTISLSHQPEAPVKLNLRSTDESEGTISITEVNLTSGNWNQPMIVMVYGVDDDQVDGDVVYTIEFSPASSKDPDFDRLNPGEVMVTNLDNDADDGNSPDTEPPIVDWVSPVSRQLRYDVVDEVIHLEVTASDNLAIDRVLFYRWDATNELFVDIATITAEPYQTELNAATLNPGWNQVFAKAFDTSGNVSERQYIWLYRIPITIISIPLVFR